MSDRPLHEPTFLLLTSLAEGPQHGYGIITDVERMSGCRVNRRVLALLAVPLALGAALYLYSLTSPQPPVAAGNVITVLPLLLILLTAVALTLVRRHRARRDIPSGPVPT